MYYYFNFFNRAVAFIEENPTAKIVAWPCGFRGDSYVVFLPKPSQDRQSNT